MVAMGEDANPIDDPADAAALAAYAADLADAVVAALPGWVERAIADRYRRWRGEDPPGAVVAAGRAAAGQSVADVEGPLRELLAQDPDEQRTNPLAIVRGAVRHPTAVLRAAGVPPVARDPARRAAVPATTTTT